MAQHARVTRIAIAVAIACSCIVSAQTPGDALLKGFQDPPNSARPRVWWHWMNGNVTKDGIRKDMEWMTRVGIGGLQNFDAALNTPQIVQNRLAYMTPEWKDVFRYAATLADQSGLELTIAASPGWSETGGPWVQPKDGMKKLVWSETTVSGGRRFEGQLAAPPSVTGPFQSMPKSGGIEALMGVEAKAPPAYYADAAVIAYRMPESREAPVPRLRSASGQALDGEAIADASYATAVEIERGTPDASGSVTLEYDAPQTIRSATVFMPGAVAMFFGASLTPSLEASDDGKSWRKVTDITLSMVPTTVSFAPATASRFRLMLNPGASGPPGLGSGAPGVVVGNFGPFGAPPKTIKIAELKLSGEPRVNQFEAKAGFAVADDYYTLDATTGSEVAGIPLDSIVDLTTKVGADGKLDWTPAAGQWKVIRFGYSLTGTTNHPATAEATGLEVDKYDGAAVRNYLNTYIDMYVDTIGRELLGKRGLRAILTDSIEVGASNWTPALIDQFQRLRGYDPRPWLPALTGVIVGSRRESDAFLYDFRRTLGDLLASEHYGQVAAVAHERGLQVYGEALESGRPSLGDDIAMRRHADIPMAALWTNPRPSHFADMKGAASVAHLYGQNLVAAESLTSAMQPWSYAPSDLKPYIDLEFAYGINRPVIHTSVHQPVDDKVPGLSLMIFGQHFNRHEAWAEMAKPWVDYISRNAFMLQQGRYFADVAYFFGEEAPLTALYERTRVADAPTRYAYDFVNPDAILNRLKVDGNNLLSESGARYRVLYLGGSTSRMTLPLLRRLASLVEAGATVVGAAPKQSPGLKDDAREFQSIVERLWGNGTKTVGKGKVIGGTDVEAALRSLDVAPDFSIDKAASDTEVMFLHRRVADGDVYFLSNRQNRAENVDARFRVTGKKAEIWRADSGTAQPVSYRSDGTTTVVPLEILPHDSFFVVFRAPAKGTGENVRKVTWGQVSKIEGPWDVAFQPGRAAPEKTRLPSLVSFHTNADPAIKYFSGTATYRKSFTLPATVKPGSPVMLDLGQVGDVAEVLVNGQPAGFAWKAPYRVDVSKAVRAGSNDLEVRVVNLWVNRLIGDAQPGANKITFTTLPTYRPDAPLRPSGLIGPVTIVAPQPSS